MTGTRCSLRERPRPAREASTRRHGSLAFRFGSPGEPTGLYFKALCYSLHGSCEYRPSRPNWLPSYPTGSALTAFTHRRQLAIEWGHCDPAGIVFNGRFFEFFDWSTWLLFEAALGVPKAKIAAVFDIAGIPIVEVRARFLVPVRFGDVVDIEAQVGAFRRSSFVVQHRLSNRGELAAEGQETRVWVEWDAGSQPKSKAIPTEVIDRFKTGHLGTGRQPA